MICSVGAAAFTGAGAGFGAAFVIANDAKTAEVVANFHTDHLYLTCVFVLLGLLRYIQITVVDKKSGDPTKVILRDHFTQLIVVAWGVSFMVIIYLL